MDLRQILTEKVDVILDPVTLNKSASEFIAEFGGSIDKINILAKHSSGNVFYDSKIAPTDPKSGAFFSKFTNIAEDLIDVYAVINTLADSYKAMDSNFASFKTGGIQSNSYICPVKDETFSYLGEVVKEVSNYPIKGIMLVGNDFINHNYCFCETCKKEFSVISGISEDFDYNRISLDDDLSQKWAKWKSDKLIALINHLVNLINQTNDNLEVGVELYWDPFTDFNKRTEIEFGQNIQEVVDRFNIVLNIYPWSPVLPQIGSVEYRSFLSSLSFTKTLERKGKDFSILYWNVNNEEDLAVLKSIKQELGAKKIFSYNSFPIKYTEMRESHLDR